jgi:hypothetical protein
LGRAVGIDPTIVRRFERAQDGEAHTALQWSVWGAFGPRP